MIGRVKKVGSDILFYAIKHGNVHDVIALLNDNEVDIDCTNINGQTPLHVSRQIIIDIAFKVVKTAENQAQNARIR